MKKLLNLISKWWTTKNRFKLLEWSRFVIMVFVGLILVTFEYLLYTSDRILTSFWLKKTQTEFETWSDVQQWKQDAVLKLLIVAVLWFVVGLVW